MIKLSINNGIQLVLAQSLIFWIIICLAITSFSGCRAVKRESHKHIQTAERTLETKTLDTSHITLRTDRREQSFRFIEETETYDTSGVLREVHRVITETIDRDTQEDRTEEKMTSGETRDHALDTDIVESSQEEKEPATANVGGWLLKWAIRIGVIFATLLLIRRVGRSALPLRKMWPF